MTSHAVVQLADDMSDSSHTNFVWLARPSGNRGGSCWRCPSTMGNINLIGGVDQSFDFSASRDLSFGDEKNCPAYRYYRVDHNICFITPIWKMAVMSIQYLQMDIGHWQWLMLAIGMMWSDWWRLGDRQWPMTMAAELKPPSADETGATKWPMIAKDGAHDAITPLTDEDWCSSREAATDIRGWWSRRCRQRVLNDRTVRQVLQTDGDADSADGRQCWWSCQCQVQPVRW